MGAALLLFVVSAAVIVIAGTALARYADAIAQLTRLGRMLVGMVLLAGATSLPEMVVDVSAIRLGSPDLAVGDLLGSSLFNLLILGVIDLVHRSGGRMFSRTASAHALSGAMSISLTALVAIGLALARQPFATSFLGADLACWAVVVVFVLGVRLAFYDQRALAAIAEATKVAGPGIVLAGGGKPMTLRRAIIGFVLACAAIFVVGPFMARVANDLALLTGLGGTFFGTCFVALCTSLPELVATVAAVRMGAFDLAVGNIFGSNSFNMTLVLLLDVAQPGSLLAIVAPTHMLTCLAVILVTTVAIMGQLYHVERRVRLIEPDALLVILLVLGALAAVFYTSQPS